MIITFLVSLCIFVFSIIVSYICNIFIIKHQILLAIPITLIMFLVTYILESKLIEKYKLNKTVYNVVTLQFPAIVSILLSLLLWILIPNYNIVSALLFSGKNILIPVMILRMMMELLNKRNASLIISCGITIGIIVGILFINTFK